MPGQHLVRAFAHRPQRAATCAYASLTGNHQILRAQVDQQFVDEFALERREGAGSRHCWKL